MNLGLPKLAGQGKFISATAIDAVGTGLILAFTIVYFVETTTLSLIEIGAAFSVGRLLAFPTAIAVGPILDRMGARFAAVLGNVISAVGFAGFLSAHSTWQIVVVTFLVQVGHTAYWTSSTGLVVLASEKPEERTRWFGFVQALRNAALGIGAAVGSVSFAVGGVWGLNFIVVANAASYALAAVLLARWQTHLKHTPSPAPPGEKGGYLTVLRDRRYLLLIAMNVTFIFAFMLIKVLLAIYIIEGLERGAWIAGALLVLNTVQITLTQTVISGWLERYRATAIIALGSVFMAASFGVFAFLDVAPDWTIIGGLFLAMVIYTLGEIVATPRIENLSISLAPAHLRGRYLAVYQLGWTSGQILAPGLFTFLLTLGDTVPLLFLMVTSLLGVPIVLAVERLILRGTHENSDHHLQSRLRRVPS